ncbi:hypothetical protein [Aureibacter tunicatorum]|uniref:hypothetical protein n=1 Tax=Aureibacter tunicatorum TaxID=866807 RepID=UPI0030CA524C
MRVLGVLVLSFLLFFSFEGLQAQEKDVVWYNNLLIGENCYKDIFNNHFPLVKIDPDNGEEINKDCKGKYYYSVGDVFYNDPQISITKDEIRMVYAEGRYSAQINNIVELLNKEDLIVLIHINEDEYDLKYSNEIAIFKIENSDTLKWLNKDKLTLNNFFIDKNYTQEDIKYISDYFFIEYQVKKSNHEIVAKLTDFRDFEDSDTSLEQVNPNFDIDFLYEIQENTPKFIWNENHWSIKQ